MLARRFACHAPTRKSFKAGNIHRHRNRSRKYSSWAGVQPSAVGSSTCPTPMSPALQAITSELDNIAPRIDIEADAIEVLKEPKDFYRVLKQKIRAAKRRIFLATLYVGQSEHELVDCIREAVQRNSELKVSILTDALRGTRESPDTSCASLLSFLAAEFPNQVEIRMYHTPNLTGLRKKIVPKRLNEGWGLQHMKIYGVDDEIMLSGANLSNDYFTNRQDRYHIFSSKAATDHYAQIFDTMCRISYLLKPIKDNEPFELKWPVSNACSSPLDNRQDFIRASRSLFEPLARPSPVSQKELEAGKASVYPVLIIPHVVNNELPAVKILLDVSSRKISACMFTAGYFNPHPLVTMNLLESASLGTKTTVVAASPWANGFYGSKGVSGMLPAAYTLLARRFLRAVANVAPDAVKFREWRLGTVGRPHAWTYHAKGLWLSYEDLVDKSKLTERFGHLSGPTVTIIGSSNYTVRSYSLDTEVGAVVVTNDPKLKNKLETEKQNLLEHSRTVTENDLRTDERKVGLTVRLAMWIVNAVGGSL